MSNRYIYHFHAITTRGDSMSGVAQVEFRITSQVTLNLFKRIVSKDGYIVDAVTSLSYLGLGSDDEMYDATKFDRAFLINKFYERYPLSEFKSDSERAQALGYFMAGAELQRLGKFIEYNDEDDGDAY